MATIECRVSERVQPPAGQWRKAMAALAAADPDFTWDARTRTLAVDMEAEDGLPAGRLTLSVRDGRTPEVVAEYRGEVPEGTDVAAASRTARSALRNQMQEVLMVVMMAGLGDMLDGMFGDLGDEGLGL